MPSSAATFLSPPDRDARGSELDAIASDRVLLQLLNRQSAVRESIRWLAQQLMEAEVAHAIHATRWQHTPERAAQRNGYRRTRWRADAGDIELQIPKLRRGHYRPTFLQRDPSARALAGAVHSAYLTGDSTHAVEHLLRQLRLEIPASAASRLVGGLNQQAHEFRIGLTRGRGLLTLVGSPSLAATERRESAR